MSAMTLIEHIEVGAGGAASITFASIPQNFTDLCILASYKTDRGPGAEGLWVEYNGNTSGYSYRRVFGDGSTTVSNAGAFAAIDIAQANTTANVFGNSSYYITNYTGSATKVLSTDGVNEANATTEYLNIYTNLWANSNPITQVKLYLPSGSLVQYSSFTLYGISSGSDGTTTVS